MESNYRILDIHYRICEVIAVGDVIGNKFKYGTNKIKILRELSWEEKKEYYSNNTGIQNVGDWNSGSRNAGNWNSGSWNKGSWNSGDSNIGHQNTGNENIGHQNTGNKNVGNWNVGDRNIGNHNIGNWNSGNGNTGFFNTKTADFLIFNKKTRKKREKIRFPSFLYFEPLVWVSSQNATDEEKITHQKEIEVMNNLTDRKSVV